MKACLNDESLSLWVDGEFSSETKAHLESCAECRERAESMAALSSALRALPLAKESASKTLRATLHGLSAGATATRRRVRRGVASALVACLVAAIMVVAPEQGGVSTALAEDAVSSHLRAFANGRSCEVETDDVDAVRAWLTEALGSPVTVPTLDGAELVGARRCQILGELAGAVVYRTPAGAVTIFVPVPGTRAAEAGEQSAGTCQSARDGQRVCVLADGSIVVSEDARI